MKKLICFCLCMMGLLLGACTTTKEKPEQTLEDLINTIEIDKEISSDLTLPQTYKLNDIDVIALWDSDKPESLSAEGKVNRKLTDEEVTLTLTLINGAEDKTKQFTVKVLGFSPLEAINLALGQITIVSETKTSIKLPAYVNYLAQRFSINWSSNNEAALTSDGQVGLIENDTNITLTASITYQEKTATKDFTIKVIALNDQEKADYVFNHINLDLMPTKNITLPTSFAFGLTGTWETSDANVITNTGVINTNITGIAQATLTLTLSNGIRRTYDMQIGQNNHMIIDRIFTGNKENVKIENNKLVLNNDALTGTYTTPEFDTFAFTEVVASWAALSSTKATCELFVRVYVDGKWSKYLSYGEWGQGLNNRATDDQDTIAKISTDEIIVLNQKKATKLQMKIVLKRQALTDDSPVVTLLAAALNIPNYTYTVDISNIRREVVYGVPQLYQHVVPNIGDIICSATSSTMLLKYKGHDFTGLANYEHEYIAGIVKDYGHNIYGNWVYNTVGMSSFGETSYVQRMYSFEELLSHLDKVGPVSASIKGSVVVRYGKNYNTNGHLIVVRGYRFEANELYILVNDPNLPDVIDEMKIDDFMKVWRNIIYVVE